MDKNFDFNNFGGYPPFSPFDTNDNNYYDNSMFNPIMQYEQAYMYYRYLTQQLEYKIKCKEYEHMMRSKSELKCHKKVGTM